MRGNTETKVQTGLRVPMKRYEELEAIAAETGVSFNAIALMLIDIGLKTVNLGIAEERRELIHSLQDKGAQHTR